MTNLELWLLFVVIGFGTFVVRVSFIQLHDKAEAMIQRSKSILILLPTAVLAALCMPGILFRQPVSENELDYVQMAAAVVAVVMTRLTKSVVWPVIGGMLCLWLLRLIVT